MTDKQIIIDGVDVSECTRYCADNGKCTAFKSQYLCSERNNCYTKRILKKNKTINILKEKLLRKEQECEELKKENYELTEEVSIDRALFAEIDQLNAENKHLNDLLNQALKELEKTRETLTEIKEIVGIGLVDGLQPEEYSGFLKILQAQILQKISECEVE